MEDDPTYDAGKGSFLNMAGEVEMDASIMNGTSLKSGSVACIQNVRHPIAVAELVLEKTDHILLVGKGALKFAKLQGIPECNPEELLTDREIEFLHAIKEKQEFKPVTVFENKPSLKNIDPEVKQQTKMGTVGCVALDIHGNIVAGKIASVILNIAQVRLRVVCQRSFPVEQVIRP